MFNPFRSLFRRRSAERTFAFSEGIVRTLLPHVLVPSLSDFLESDKLEGSGTVTDRHGQEVQVAYRRPNAKRETSVKVSLLSEGTAPKVVSKMAEGRFALGAAVAELMTRRLAELDGRVPDLGGSLPTDELPPSDQPLRPLSGGFIN